MLFSPLEQFEINILQKLCVGPLDFSLTNSTLFCFLAFSLLYLFFLYSVSNARVFPGRWQSTAELLYLFILLMARQQAGKQSWTFFPLFFAAFTMIFALNFLGLFPLAFTVTSHIIITFSLALAFNLGFLILGFSIHKLKFFRLFVPSGVPVLLLPLIAVIEVISYLVRTFSLALRLFANMMGGHTLIQILSSFFISALMAPGLLFLSSILAFLVILGITVLEIAIAAIQAYVFTILLTIYINDAFHVGH
jgi:F-type H+-transporting ATPase subunit a